MSQCDIYMNVNVKTLVVIYIFVLIKTKRSSNRCPSSHQMMTSCFLLRRTCPVQGGLQLFPLRRVVNKLVRRHFETSQSANSGLSTCRLSSRGIIRLSGPETPNFLQGLVTNDTNFLLENCPSLQYCMMLNVQVTFSFIFL